MYNSYRKLADMCDKLTHAFIGKEVFPKPSISISEDNKHVVVVWSQLENIFEDERSKLVVEAYHQAFEQNKGLLLCSAIGPIEKESNIKK